MHRFLLPALLTLALVGTAPPIAADGHGEDEDRYEEGLEEAGEKLREHRESAEKKSGKHRDKAREHTGEQSGKAKGELMRKRRDDRKAIKDDYDAEIEAGADRVKGKKPWWKFWGD